MRRRTTLGWLAAAAVPIRAYGAGALTELDSEMSGARLRGAGRLDFLGLHIYDIRLWVTEGFSAGTFAQSPIALEIEYARALTGHRMADRSLTEMERLTALTDDQRSRWLSFMKRAFPDVQKGERVTGVLRPGEAVRFFHEGRLRAEMADADFGRAFFGIWLSPRTSEPALRLALLGART